MRNQILISTLIYGRAILTKFTPLPQQPHDLDGPVFNEPWEAQAFGMAVSLEQKGIFTWTEWTETIGGFIKNDPIPDLTGERYYQYWLIALEALVSEKTEISSVSLLKRKNEWDIAAKATPHGMPIKLDNI